MLITKKNNILHNITELSLQIIENMLGLEITAERLSRLEGCLEHLLMEGVMTENQNYEQNCTIARLFIEEHLGLAPTPERINRAVEFIKAMEKVS